MARQSTGTRSQLIRCSRCGEEYSDTYKRCPFCGTRREKPGGSQATGRFDLTSRLGGGRRSSAPESRSRAQQDEYEDDYVFDGGDVFDDNDNDNDYDEDEDYYTRRGGKRLEGGGLDIPATTIATIVFSAVLVIAAILIVVLVVIPMVRDGATQPAENEPNGSLPGTSSVSPAPNTSAPVSPDISSSPSVPAGEDPGGPASSAPVDDPGGSTTSQPIPASQTATGFSINQSEFTISDRYPDPVTIKVTFSPAGSTGTITWSSSNTSVATVDSSGKVTGVGKGRATITASMPGAVDRTCVVIVNISGGGGSGSSAPTTSSSPNTTTSSGSFSINQSEFTISDRYPDPVKIKASNATGTVTWSSSNSSIATVSSDGTVTRVGKGTCTITATDGAGNSASCKVHCA